MNFIKFIPLYFLLLSNFSHAEEVASKFSNDFCLDGRCTKAREVVAKAVSPAILGAVVCKNYDSVRSVISIYNNNFNSQINAMVVGKQANELMNGKSSLPDLSKHGCVFVKSGELMMWNDWWTPTIVRVKLSNGKVFEGVTDPSMIQVVKTEPKD